MNESDGSGDGTQWATGSGYLHGIFANDWMGFRATNKSLRIRFSDFFRFEDDCIVECYSQIDIIDFLQQIDCDPLPLVKRRALHLSRADRSERCHDDASR